MHKLRRIYRKILVIFLFMSSFNLCAQNITNTAFKDGEQLYYTGYYNLGMLWVKAGKVDILTSKKLLNNRDVFNIKAVGTSLPGWDWFYKLRDTFEVHCDTSSLLPLRFHRIVHEGKYHAYYKYDFNYCNNRYYSRIKRKDKPVYSTSRPLYMGTLDMLSFAWYARNLDYSAYDVGEKIKVRLLISNRIYNLYIRYLGIDIVQTRDGTNVECHKFSPLLLKGSSFKGGEDMTVWVSNDKNRVPVMAEAKVVIGNVKGVLSSYKGLRHKSTIFPESDGNLDKR